MGRFCLGILLVFQLLASGCSDLDTGSKGDSARRLNAILIAQTRENKDALISEFITFQPDMDRVAAASYLDEVFRRPEYIARREQGLRELFSDEEMQDLVDLLEKKDLQLYVEKLREVVLKVDAVILETAKQNIHIYKERFER
jgi:hypothetical protein